MWACGAGHCELQDAVGVHQGFERNGILKALKVLGCGTNRPWKQSGWLKRSRTCKERIRGHKELRPQEQRHILQVSERLWHRGRAAAWKAPTRLTSGFH